MPIRAPLAPLHIFRDNDTTISVVDASGVALASIQALEQENDDLRRRVAELEAMMRQLVAH